MLVTWVGTQSGPLHSGGQVTRGKRSSAICLQELLYIPENVCRVDRRIGQILFEIAPPKSGARKSPQSEGPLRHKGFVNAFHVI